MQPEWERTRTLLRRLHWPLVKPLANRPNGDERSTLLGPGVEFATVREYQPGDDVRRIDWNLTARLNTPYVREAHADGAIDVWLLVDVSGSVDWGTGECLKRYRAIELAAVTAQLLGHRGNRVGLVLFAERPVAVVPQGRGRLAPRSGYQHVEPPPAQHRAFGDGPDRRAPVAGTAGASPVAAGRRLGFSGAHGLDCRVAQTVPATRSGRRTVDRSARGGAAGCRHRRSGRSGDRRAAHGRHARPTLARAIRRRGGGADPTHRRDPDCLRRRSISCSTRIGPFLPALAAFLESRKGRRAARGGVPIGAA